MAVNLTASHCIMSSHTGDPDAWKSQFVIKELEQEPDAVQNQTVLLGVFIAD